MKLKYLLATIFAVSVGVAAGVIEGSHLIYKATLPKTTIHAVVVETPPPRGFKVGDRVKVKACFLHEATGVIVSSGFGECSVLFITERGEASRIIGIPTSVLQHND